MEYTTRNVYDNKIYLRAVHSSHLHFPLSGISFVISSSSPILHGNIPEIHYRTRSELFFLLLLSCERVSLLSHCKICGEAWSLLQALISIAWWQNLIIFCWFLPSSLSLSFPYLPPLTLCPSILCDALSLHHTLFISVFSHCYVQNSTQSQSAFNANIQIHIDGNTIPEQMSVMALKNALKVLIHNIQDHIICYSKTSKMNANCHQRTEESE